MSATTKDGAAHEDTRTTPSPLPTRRGDGEAQDGEAAEGEPRDDSARDAGESSADATDDSTASLWWGIGAAAPVAAVAGTLVWRRGRGPRTGGGEG
jgi:hypothetical protein